MPTRREYQNEYHRQRWLTDPDYRERKKAKNKEWRKRNAEKLRAYAKKYRKRGVENV